MRRFLRFPSLFWTFAAAFLTVLIAAAVLQSWVVVVLLNRITIDFAEDAAATRIKQVGNDLSSWKGPLQHRNIVEMLRRSRSEDPTLWLLFRPVGGALVPDRFLNIQRLRRLADQLGIPFERPPPFGARFGREAGPPRRRLPPLAPNPAGGIGPPPPFGARFGREAGPPRRRLPPLTPNPASGIGPPVPIGPAGDNDRTIQQIRVLHRQPVSRDGQALGELIAVHVEFSDSPWFASDRVRALLFIPIAVLLAAGAGLLLFRILLTRIHRLERFADRVAGGDLAARIPDPEPDEIGRLAGRLNHMAAALFEARNRVEAGECQRRRLLADISHELGTPLTSIRGYAETLLDASVPKSETERRHYLEDVLDEAKRMTALLQDLYELVRLEGDPDSMALEELDFTALCMNTVKRFQPRFRQASIRLAWEGKNQSVWILADGRRMEQVVDNLLANTLRHVPAGGRVTLSLERGEHECRLQVSDTGPGVPAGELRYLFDRFYRAASAERTAGSGLGLAIVKEIVARHEGRVFAQNVHPTGLCITVVLPLPVAVSS